MSPALAVALINGPAVAVGLPALFKWLIGNSRKLDRALQIIAPEGEPPIDQRVDHLGHRLDRLRRQFTAHRAYHAGSEHRVGQ